MAGLDDYQFYTKLQDQDNPFWEKADPDDILDANSSTGEILRPTDFPQQLQHTPSRPTQCNGIVRSGALVLKQLAH